MASAPIDVALNVKGLQKLKDLEKRMEALEKDVSKLNKTLPVASNNIRKTGKAAATATGNIQRFGVAFRSTLGPIVAVYGGIQILNRSLGVLSDRQADTKLLTNGLQKLGGTASDLKKLQQQADKFGDSTLFNQEDFTAGAGLLTSFTSVAVKDYERVINVAADLAQTNKGPVKDSLLQVAKALNAPSQNLTALSRSGIQFTEQQKEQIKTLEESGRLLEAQTLILSELERQYGGNAKAAATGFAGAVDTLGENFRDFQETLAQGVLPAAESFVGVASQLFETLSQIDPVVIQVGLNIAGAATATFLWVKAINALKATALVSWLARVVPLIAAGKAGLVAMTVKTALLTKATAALKVAMLSLPWVGAATAVAGLAAVTADYYIKQNRMKQLIDGSTVSTDELKDAIVGQKTQLEAASEKLRKMEENGTSNARAIAAQERRVIALRQELELLQGTYDVKVNLEIQASQIAAEVERRATAAGGRATGFDTLSQDQINEAIQRANGTFVEPGSKDGKDGKGGKKKSDGTKEIRKLQQQIALLQTKDELAKKLLKIRFDEENAVARIKDSIQASAQADAIRLEGILRQAKELEVIEQFADKALQDADALIASTEEQITADARRAELIAEGINPALADELVKIEEIFGKEKEKLELLILQLETQLAQIDAESELAKKIQETIDKLKEKLKLLGKAQDDAEGNAKDKNPDDPGKIEQYIKQLETELTDFEGMVVSLAQTIQTELAGAMSNAITGIIDGTQTAEEAFANMFKNIGKAFIDMATQMIAKALVMKALGILFPGASGGGGLLGGGGAPGGWSIPNAAVPKTSGMSFFADGGRPPMGMPSIVGERGPELFVPDGPGTILSNSQSRAAMDRYAANNNGTGDGTFKLETVVINNVEYATVEQVAAMGKAAAREGAMNGNSMTMNKLRNSRASRSKIGLGR